MIRPELRGRPGTIRIPVVTGREYALVCIGSPTWWLSTNVPIRSLPQPEPQCKPTIGIGSCGLDSYGHESRAERGARHPEVPGSAMGA